MRAALRLPPGPVDLTAIDTRCHARLHGGKADGQGARWSRSAPSCRRSRSGCTPRASPASATAGCCWCCRAWTPPARAACSAHGRPGRPAGGADHVVQGADARRSAHDFLWRIREALPEPGPHRASSTARHYEDVLIARVRELAPKPDEIERRYDAINDFEAELGRAPAPRSSSACCTSRPRSRRSGCWPGSTTRPSTGSSTRSDVDERGRCGRSTSRPTRSRSSAPTPRSRRGTSSRATTSGTATWPIGQLLHETLRAIEPAVAGGRLRRRGAEAAAHRRDADLLSRR